MRRFGTYSVLWAGLLLLGQVAFASPAVLTYQGRIVKSDGRPLEYSSVSFLFQITSPNGLCVIYEEQLNGINMVNSGGVFDSPIGAGTRLFPTVGGFSLLEAFNNTGPFACKGGAVYNPIAQDGRLLRVQFHDGTGWKVISPDNVIRSVPYAAFASSAMKLGAYTSDEFLLKTGIPTCDPGEFSSWNGTGFSCDSVSGSNGGTVTNVSSGNAYVTVTNPGTTPVLTLQVGTGANTVAAGNDARFSDARTPTGAASGDLGDNYPSPKVVKLQGVSLSAAAPNDGEFLKFNAGTWASASASVGDIAGLTTTLGGLVPYNQIPTTCSSSQTLHFISPVGGFSCTDIVVSGSNFATQTAHTIFAGPLSGSGTPSFRTLTIADLPSAVTEGAWSADGSGNVSRLTGNVGIGTASPEVQLHVNNSSDSQSILRLSSSRSAIAASTSVIQFTASASPAAAGKKNFSIYNINGASGGENALAFASHNDDYSTFSPKMTLTHGGFIGIGTTNPMTKLEVVGTVKATAFEGPLTASINSTGAGSASSPSMTFTGDPDTGFYNTSSDNTIGVAAGGTNIFNFSSLGLVSSTVGGASVSTAAGIAGAPTFSFAGDTDTGWFSPAADTLAASTAGAERIRIDPTGNIGIGTMSPSSKLDIIGTTASDLISIRRPSDGNIGVHTIGTVLEAGNYHISYNNNAGNRGHVWFTNDGTTNQERMRITGAGSVGIGTATPTAKLHVFPGWAGFSVNDTYSPTGFWGTAGIGFNVSRSAANTWLYPSDGSNAGGALIDANVSGDLRFFTRNGSGNTTSVTQTDAQMFSQIRMIVDRDGKLGVGTLSPGTQFSNNSNNTHSSEGVGHGGTSINWAANSNGYVQTLFNASTGATANGLLVKGAGTASTNALFAVDAGATQGTGGTALLRVLGNGSVGIGITNPVAQLQIGAAPNYTGNTGVMTIRTDSSTNKYGLVVESGDSANSQGAIAVHGRSTSMTGDLVKINANGNSALSTFNLLNVMSGDTAGNGTGTSRFVVRGDGNVGIGTVNPSSDLDILSSTGSLTQTRVVAGAQAPDLSLQKARGTVGTLTMAQSGDSLGHLNFRGYDGASYIRGVRIASFIDGTPATSSMPAGLLFATNSGAADAVERMRISSTGNVGIGTAAPAAKLQINGDMRLGIITNQDDALSGNYGNRLYFSGGDDWSGFDSDNSDEIWIARYNEVSDTSKLRINVGDNNSGLDGISFGRSSSGNWYSAMDIITSSGTVGIGTTAPSYALHVVGDTYTSGYFRSPNGTIQTSDARLKHNVSSIENSLEKILSLRGVTYDWKRAEFPEREFSERRQMGVLAQDVEAPFPEAVITDKDGYKAVNYSSLVAPLINAVKELFHNLMNTDARVAQLEEENTRLKNKINALEEKFEHLEKEWKLNAARTSED